MPRYITEWRSWALGDVIAGATVAVTSLPQYIAYVELAGLAGYRGIPASGPPLVGFAFLTGSPCLCIGVTSITALMSFADLRGAEYKEAHGEEAWVDLLGTYSMFVGIASLVLALLGAARLVAFIPKPVKAGWKLGFALAAFAAQAPGAAFGSGILRLKKICTLPNIRDAPLSGGAAAMYRLGWMAVHPLLWDPSVVMLAALTLVIVLGGKSVFQRFLGVPGLEVIVATVVGTLLALHADYAGDVVGMAPPAPPSAAGADTGSGAALLTSWVRRWPWEMPIAFTAEHLGGWPWAVTSALAFASVDFLAIVSVEAEQPAPGGSAPGRELAGQGLGCVLSGMAGSAPVGGSLTRSMVAGMTGASSPLMGLVCGLTTVCLGFPQVASVLAHTPKSVLAATVLAAVLPAVVRPKDLLKLRGSDVMVGWSTAAATCATDPTKGFCIGLALYAATYPVRRLTTESKVKKNE